MKDRPVGHAIDVHARASLEHGSAPLAADTPFHILILGDFAGRGAESSRPGLSERVPHEVDRDELDAVMRRIVPTVELGTRGAGSNRVGFHGLEDFHPDRLCERVPHLKALVSLRARLADPSTFRRAYEEIEAERPAGPGESEAGTPAEEAAPSAAAGGSLLDAIVSGSPTVDVSPTVGEELNLDAFVRAVVRPHLVATDPRQPEVLSRMDRAIGSELRAILHDPAYQDLERAWRSTWLLVRRLETSPTLKVFVFDISRSEIRSGADADHALRRVIVDERTGTPGAVPWSLIVADFACGASEEDVAVMRRLAECARLAGAPAIAAADPSLVVDGSWPSDAEPVSWNDERAPAWTALRRTPDATWLAMTFPRFLLRMPYGMEDDPCDAVPFEEALPEGLRHEHYLWGHAGFVMAILLGRQFAATGSSPRLSANLQLDGLPLYLRRAGGDATVLPCAEILASERWAADVLDHGVIPVMSVKDADSVRIARVQSTALPAVSLAGRWS